MSEQSGSTNKRSARQVAQRNQILDAASECFLTHGFHGASMALIAGWTKMSVGQIYRFFVSKEAIIAAIVERQLARASEHFGGSDAFNSHVARGLPTSGATLIGDNFVLPERAGLIVEIRAEAARNPAIAAIVEAADLVIAGHVRMLVTARSSAGTDAAEIDRRAKMLMIIFDGAIFRASIDHETNAPLVNEIVELVCRSDPSGDGSGTAVSGRTIKSFDR